MSETLINKKKIYNAALENANLGKTYFNNFDKKLFGLKLEEQILMTGFTYVLLLARLSPMPDDVRKSIMLSMVKGAEAFARDIQQYRRDEKKRIELIIPTEQLTTDFAKQMNAGKFDEALTTACKLLDIYQFGISDSHINLIHLERARAKHNK